MATSDEISRTEAPTFDFEMKFYVGGPYALANLHAITAGSGYTATVSTTTTADVDEDSTTIPVVSTSGFTTGFVVIHPEDTGELYEVIGYGGTTSTTFTAKTGNRSSLQAESLLGRRAECGNESWTQESQRLPTGTAWTAPALGERIQKWPGILSQA